MFVVCGALSASLGMAAGYFLGQRESIDVAHRIDLYATAQSRYTSFLFGASRNGSSDEDLLHAYLTYLEARAREHDAPNANVYAFDRALALVRLSEIARGRGASGDAMRLQNEADAVCPATGLRNCSASELQSIAHQRDRRVWVGSRE